MTQLRTGTEFDKRLLAEDTAEAYEPSQVDIESRAYARYLERGCLDGFDLDDWLAAEAEVRQPGEVGA